MVPLDKMVIETDSPYLTPEPYRGKINSSKNIPVIAELLAKELEQKMKKQDFDFEDFLTQMEQIENMGPLDKVLGMIPGMGNLKNQLGDVDLNGKEMRRTKAIIQSMTLEERRNPQILNASRKRRIAKGSGTSVQDINRLVKQLNEMKKMMKMFMGNQKGIKKRGALSGLPFFK